MIIITFILSNKILEKDKKDKKGKKKEDSEKEVKESPSVDKEQKEDGTYYSYDGHNYGYISAEELKEMKAFKTDYLPIFRDAKHDTIANESYDKTDKKSRKYKVSGR